MGVERALLEFEIHLPPLPKTSCDKLGLLYHPREKSLWMLDFAGSLWRYQNEAWSLLSNAKDLMPEGYSHTYSWSFHFYWDERRASAVCFATGYGGTELPVMGVWNGKRFEAIVPENALKSSNRDAFAWDAGRSVLVHFVSVRDGDPRFASGTLRARELDDNAVWRDVGPAQTMSDPVDMMAGYDRGLRATVCINADGDAFAWDGEAWKTVAVEARYPWFPYATAPAPGTGGMVFVYAPRETGKWPAHLLELAGGKLREKPVTTMRLSGGMAHDSDRDVTYVYGPWFGDGTLQCTLGTYSAGAFSPAGRVAAEQTPFAAPGYLFVDVARSCFYRLHVAASGSKPMAEVLPGPSGHIAHAVTRSGIYAVGKDGATWLGEFGGAPFAKRAVAPKGFPERASTCLGVDYHGDRVLLVSGAPPGYGPYQKDAWLLAEGKWTNLPLTGTAPALDGAAVIYDAERARWIVVGGRDKAYKEGLKTFETDEKKWRAFPTRFLDAKGQSTGAKHVGLLAFDAPSRRTFCCAGLYSHDRAYVYEGEGLWRLLTEEPARGAYDIETRTLAWRATDGDGRVRILDIGACLDRAPAAAPAPKTKGSPAPSAVASVPKEVWLRYQDDRSDKVWFARLEAASFTVRFGKRGGALQEKTTAFATRPLAQAKYRALVEEKLEKGYEHAPEGEAIAKLPGLRAWHLAGKQKSNDVWGGVPQGVPASDWPACAECKKPMIHVVTFHAHPERLPLENHGALMAFICGEELCEFWDADMGANKVLLRTTRDLAKATLKAPPQGVQKAKQRVLAYQEVFEVDEELEPNAVSPTTCDKVGGYPAWIQGGDVPQCKKCKAPMRFVAQLNEHDLNFAGGGIAYLFVCSKEHAGAMLMQR